MAGNKDRAARETYYYSVEYETGSPNHQQLVNAQFHSLCSLTERAVPNVMNLKVVLEVDEEPVSNKCESTWTKMALCAWGRKMNR